jgi:hypothetical protein
LNTVIYVSGFKKLYIHNLCVYVCMCVFA